MNEDLKRWDEIAERWTKEIEPKRLFRPIFVQSALDTLLNKDLGGKEILDAGCGDGVHSKYLKDKGANVIGTDGAQNMIRLAKSNYPNMDFREVDLLEQLPFSDSSFDYVISILVFMSLSNIGNFLSEANRVLKPNGELIFIVHHPCFGNTSMQLYKSLWNRLTGDKPKGLIETYYPGLKIKRSGEKGVTKNIPYYHRTLQDYSEALLSSKFLTKQILEPNRLPEEFLANSPKLEYVTRLPRFIVYDCVKT